MNVPRQLEGVYDTTVVVHNINGVPRAVQLMRDVALGRLEAGVSSMTSYELWLTRPLSLVTDTAYRLALLLLRELPIDHAIAEATARELRLQPRARRAKLLHDAIIAHTAIQYGVPVYTGDKRVLSFGARVITYDV